MTAALQKCRRRRFLTSCPTNLLILVMLLNKSFSPHTSENFFLLVWRKSVLTSTYMSKNFSFQSNELSKFANSGNVAEQIIQPTHEWEVLATRSFLEVYLEIFLSLDIGEKVYHGTFLIKSYHGKRIQIFHESFNQSERILFCFFVYVLIFYCEIKVMRQFEFGAKSYNM